jgi:Ca2+-binding EF-hand superfamily protein
MRADEDIPANARSTLGAVAILLTLVLAGCGGTETAPAGNASANPINETSLRKYFTTMDQDGDGFISRPEFEAERGAVFLAIDRNNSLSLTADEMHLTPEAFSQLAGGDATVTPDEFVGSDTTSFEQIDSSGDKQISYEELRGFVIRFGS